MPNEGDRGAPFSDLNDDKPGDREFGDPVSVTGGPQDKKERSDGLQTDPAPSTRVDEGAGKEVTKSVGAVQRPAENAGIDPRAALPQHDRPSADNTGPSDRGALTRSASIKVTTDGAVLENLDISGMIKIDADNVTVRNFRVEATSFYGILVADGHSGIVLEDGEIYGMRSAAILGVGYNARRLHIHDSGGDGTKVQGRGGPTVVEHCFIERLGTNDGAHADGNQTSGPGGSNITFRYNNIWMPVVGPNFPGAPYKANANFMTGSVPVSNFVIEYNWLNGGGYTIYGKPGIFVRNNFFGRDYRYGLKSGSFSEWSGNRWEDTGEPI